MENQILIFRTSITKRRDIKLIGSLLAKFPQITRWNVDFEDWEKVLRIECSNITALEISETLRNSHIFATELECFSSSTPSEAPFRRTCIEREVCVSTGFGSIRYTSAPLGT